MKMKELERRSGVSRETIRFYIRKGLLPEPEKPKPNVAVYSEEHVNRLALIKELQEQRFLPLDVIKSLLDQHEGQELPDRMSLKGLEFALAARLGIKGQKVDLHDLLETIDLPDQEARDIAKLGLIDIISKGQREWVSEPDSMVLRLWSQLKQAGFNDSINYDFHIMARHQKIAEELARQDVEEFFANVSSKKPTHEAARLGETGIALTNELFGLLRNKAIIREVARVNALDKDTSEDEISSDASDRKSGVNKRA